MILDVPYRKAKIWHIGRNVSDVKHFESVGHLESEIEKEKTMIDKEIVQTDYAKAITDIKSAVLQSRYRAASLANRELLLLYFSICEYISDNTRNKNWGKGAINIISDRLQQELPGLSGFSATNLKNMRIFYEEWKEYIAVHLLFAPIGTTGSISEIRQLPTAEFAEPNNSLQIIRQLPTAELEEDLSIRQLLTAEIVETNKPQKSNRQLPTAEIQLDGERKY